MAQAYISRPSGNCRATWGKAHGKAKRNKQQASSGSQQEASAPAQRTSEGWGQDGMVACGGAAAGGHVDWAGGCSS